MEEKKKYFLFADECGDSNLSVYEKSFPVFTLCGIIVSREQIRKLERDVKALEKKQTQLVEENKKLITDNSFIKKSLS